MDLFLLFLIISCVSFLAVSKFAKDERLRAAASKVMYAAAALIVIYLSVTQYLAGSVSPDPAPDPSPAITVTDPSGPETGDPEPQQPASDPGQGTQDPVIDENGTYDSKEDVALYIHTYGKLPPNYITKNEAEKLGWNGGSVEKYAPGKCIGGSRFYNNEKKLPEKNGRKYYECDIDTLGASSRGTKRLIYSNDGLIYYTDDHYKTFEQLYGGGQ